MATPSTQLYDQPNGIYILRISDKTKPLTSERSFWINKSTYVYLVKNASGKYSVYCNVARKQVIIATSIDSIILTPRYGTILYGNRKNKKIKQWHYIDVSSSKNIYGG